jgi:hypothetical protein
MTFLDQREIRDLADAVCQHISEHPMSYPSYSGVHAAVTDVLTQRYGADRTKVDRFDQTRAQWYLDEPSRVVHQVQRVGVKTRTGESELASSPDAEGSLWLLQRRLGDAKFDFIKSLIEHGQQTVAPIEASVEIIVEAEVVSVEAGNVAPRDQGQYAYESYTLSSGVI